MVAPSADLGRDNLSLLWSLWSRVSVLESWASCEGHLEQQKNPARGYQPIYLIPPNIRCPPWRHVHLSKSPQAPFPSPCLISDVWFRKRWIESLDGGTRQGCLFLWATSWWDICTSGSKLLKRTLHAHRVFPVGWLSESTWCCHLHRQIFQKSRFCQAPDSGLFSGYLEKMDNGTNFMSTMSPFTCNTP